jgi:hypothetical protein
MRVDDLVQMAQNSELRTLAVAQDEKIVIGYINLGLVELYKRFPIETKEVLITLEGDSEIYILPEDCMYLIAAYGEIPEYSSMLVNELPINEESNPLSINTVAWNKIQVPASIEGQVISLIYAASPELIRYDEETGAHNYQDIPLPASLIEALLHYVGYRAHAAVDGNIQAENSTHYTRFEASCNRVESLGTFTRDELCMDSRIADRGFV